MWMLARGKRLDEIANELELRPSTVSAYRARNQRFAKCVCADFGLPTQLG
jgi:FixJ family two-component response regulator